MDETTKCNICKKEAKWFSTKNEKYCDEHYNNNKKLEYFNITSKIEANNNGNTKNTRCLWKKTHLQPYEILISAKNIQQHSNDEQNENINIIPIKNFEENNGNRIIKKK